MAEYNIFFKKSVMRIGETINTFLESTLGRLLLFGVLGFAGFRLGLATPTALPYRDHHPLWDTLARSAFWLLIGLVFPFLVFIKSSTFRWFVISLSCALLMAFLSGWGFRFIFTK